MVIMKFTKGQLIQEVSYHKIKNILLEVNIDDVLSGKHYQDVSDEVNSMEKFQDGIQSSRKFIDTIVEYITASPENLNQWIHMMITQFGYDPKQFTEQLSALQSFLNSNDIYAWAQRKITDELIVFNLEKLGYSDDLDDDRKQHLIAISTHVAMAHILNEFLTSGA